jgi:AcrR family transcriptional regulator
LDTKRQQARESIIKAAGPLFSEYGFDGVSTRTLSSVANVNIAAINYYFGGKEELFFEVVKVAACDSRVDLCESFRERLDTTESHDELVELLREAIHAKVHAYLDEGEPEERWKRRLMLRIFLDEGDAMRQTVEGFRPEHETQVELFKRLNPDLSDIQAQLAVFSMVGQLSFYIFARSPILVLLNKDGFDEHIIDELKVLVYRNLQDVLNLPA